MHGNVLYVLIVVAVVLWFVVLYGIHWVNGRG
jgi:nitrogen fixation-related uncharacterized protein